MVVIVDIKLQEIMDIHNNTHPHKDTKYTCGICGYQTSNKNSLARHKKIVHEWVKYPCRQCNYQANKKSQLTEHQKAVHEGVKYPCESCGKQYFQRRSLAVHNRAVHEGKGSTTLADSMENI